MIREYRKIVRVIKKYRRKFVSFLKKYIPVLRKIGKWKKFIWSWGYMYIGSIDEKLIVLKSNNGKDCSGFPAYLYEKMTKNERFKDYKFAWLVQKKKDFKHMNSQNTRVYSAGSKKGIRTAARAHYLIVNNELPKYNRLRKQQVLIFEPEEHYGYYLAGTPRSFISENREELALPFSRVIARADYVIENCSENQKFLALAGKQIGNEKIEFIHISYLVSMSENHISEKERSEIELPDGRENILFAFRNNLYCKQSFLDAVNNENGGKRSYLFRKKIFLKSEQDVEAVCINRCKELEEDSVVIQQETEREAFDYDTSDTFWACPGKFSKADAYSLADVVITNQYSCLVECIWMQKPVIGLTDEWLYTRPQEIEAIWILKKVYPDLLLVEFEDLHYYLEQGVNTVIASRSNMCVGMKEGELNLFAFIKKEVGSADGTIKSFFRKRPLLFSILKSINQKAYNFKSAKRRLACRFKDEMKKVDLKVLHTYYTATGFWRSHGCILTSNARKLHSYKNKYSGRRCFLIGNGPSLKVSDLEMLEDEITMGCNRVYKLFNETRWRPNYYCMIDALIAKYSADELTENISCPMFTNINTRDLMKVRPDELIFARNLGESEYRVSENFEGYYVPSGATVMTFMLELAMYMGFSEIYLLGVDCTSSLSAQGHCAKGYVNEELIQKDIERIRKRLNNPDLNAKQVAEYYYDKSTYSYHVLKEYADRKGIHIYNATRGGRLEVFERRDIDYIMGR